MATANKIVLPSSQAPIYHRLNITEEQSDTASRILQDNHESHHIFFNNAGFHNHVVHQTLSLWALGASPELLNKAYEANVDYQKSSNKMHSDVVSDVNDERGFQKHLGIASYYNDYLEFFRHQIEESSWQAVLEKYVFSGSPIADDMFVRLHDGLIHPLIHLGFAIDFHQPALVAEALAMTAVHKNKLVDLLAVNEDAARVGRNKPFKSIMEILDELQEDKTARNRTELETKDNKDPGADDRLRYIKRIAEYKVDPDNLDEKVAEMVNAVCCLTAGAQRPSRVIKFDFYFIHGANASMFYPAFMKEDWLSKDNKIRLLEWKVRYDLATYAEMNSPTIHLDEIKNYKPKRPSDWDGIEDRACAFMDDGHAVKLVRALAAGQSICKPYDHKEEFRIKHDDWLQMAHMAMDSVEPEASTMTNGTATNVWVRGAGLDGAWEHVTRRKHQS